MRLTPRKAEVAAVLALLESEDEFDTLEDLAKDIIEAVAQEFTKRDWYAFGIHVGDTPIGFGPLPTEHETRKFAERLGWSGAAVKLYAVDKPELPE